MYHILGKRESVEIAENVCDGLGKKEPHLQARISCNKLIYHLATASDEGHVTSDSFKIRCPAYPKNRVRSLL